MTPVDRSPLWFFLAVMLLSAPFWFLGAVTAWEPLPGVPVSALMFLVPGLVAYALVAHAESPIKATRWLFEVLKPSSLRHAGWVLVAVSVPPGILFAAYATMSLAGYSLPAPEISTAAAVTLFGVFLIPAVCEEVGWSGFALVALQRRMSALQASLLIGSIWAAWHFIPLLQAHRSITWIAWWCLTTLALRILITWVFNNTAGSVLLAALVHASENASWQSFPNRGSHYDPAVHAVMLWVACSVIIAWYGPRTLARPALSPQD